MTKAEHTLVVLIACCTALAITGIGTVSAMPIILSGRALPGIHAGSISLSGLPKHQLQEALTLYERDMLARTVTLSLREHVVTRSFEDLGVRLDAEATAHGVDRYSLADVLTGNRTIAPTLFVDKDYMQQQLREDFAETIQPPQNATLAFDTAGRLYTIPGQPGEQVNVDEVIHAMQSIVTQANANSTIELSVTTSPPRVEDSEVESAQVFAAKLLSEGMKLIYDEEEFVINAYTLRRLITFQPQVDPTNHSNYILGVAFDPALLAEYIETTIVPEVNQTAQDARFTLSNIEESGIPARVEQFALPQEGRQLNIEKSTTNIAASLAGGRSEARLAVDVTQPNITSTEDIERLGITTLLATGESDFVGSPKNRIHNIHIGANRYHGSLIGPGEEFSFNALLGPVTAAAGFLPELVIKDNVTTPEYGGGLCQVSTTIFRAALNSGLEITQRRNHSYAVSYYGTPGLDATIYPPYTDLRFRNNTPGHILVQQQIIGTKLKFEFWGTDDGREVTVNGPVTYDRQPDGAVKAYVEQSVVKEGQTIIDDTFYSRYRSPKLFPRARSENGET